MSSQLLGARSGCTFTHTRLLGPLPASPGLCHASDSPCCHACPPEYVHDTAPRGTGSQTSFTAGPSPALCGLGRCAVSPARHPLPNTITSFSSAQCHLPDKPQANQACCHHHQLPALPVSLSSCPHRVSHRPSAATCCACPEHKNDLHSGQTCGLCAGLALLPTAHIQSGTARPRVSFLALTTLDGFPELQMQTGQTLELTQRRLPGRCTCRTELSRQPGPHTSRSLPLSSPSQSHGLTVHTALPVVQPASWTCARFDGVSNPNL